MCNKGRYGNSSTQAATGTLTSKQRPPKYATKETAVTKPAPVLPDPGPTEPTCHQGNQLAPQNPEVARRPRPRHGETRIRTAIGRPHTTANYKHAKCPLLLKDINHLEGSQESLGSSQDSLGSAQDFPCHTPRILLTTPGNTKYDCESKLTIDAQPEETHSNSMPTLFIRDKKLTQTHPSPLLIKRRPKKCTGRVKLPPLSIPGNNSFPTVQRQRSFSDPDIKLPRLTHL